MAALVVDGAGAGRHYLGAFPLHEHAHCFRPALQVVLGGVLVFLTGLLIGNA